MTLFITVCVRACAQLLAFFSKLQSTQTRPRTTELPLAHFMCKSVCVFGQVAHHSTHVNLHTLSKFICKKKKTVKQFK